jgi:hypothetical protein
MSTDSPRSDRTYRTKRPPRAVIEAARQMAGDASAMSAACAGDVHLWTELHHVRFLTPEHAARLLTDAGEVVEVRWQAWIHSHGFDTDLLKGLETYVESAVVLLDDLLEGQAVTYGLGPENAFIEAEINDADATSPPQPVLEALAQHMVESWSDHLVEWAEGDQSFLESWPQELREAAEDILRQHAEAPDPPEPTCPECGAPTGTNLLFRYCTNATCRARLPKG